MFISNKIDPVITSYNNPDLDGTACVVSYQELLRKLGLVPRVHVFGNISCEAKFMLKHVGISEKNH